MPEYLSTSQLRITALTEKARKGLTKIERDQFPFALAKTLTDIAKMAVKSVQKKTRQEFDLKTEFVPKGIRFKSANKRDIQNKGIGTTIVYTAPIISGWMPSHEYGGTRRPLATYKTDKGKYFALPGEDFKNTFLTSTGKVKNMYKPSRMLENFHDKSRRGSGTPLIVRRKKKHNKKAFIIRSSGRKKGTGKRDLNIFYVLVKESKYKPVWDFEETVLQRVNRHFTSRLKRNLKKSVLTAR